ncbi:MAG TPA: hypothetical protein VJN18_01660 [Polyangiaceae bacterium]|nr:hypothetical protein [Polyangiaceae bacterium]
MKLAFAVVGLLLAVSGCSARYAVLTVPAISMTNPSFQSGATGTPSGHVESTYCRGDDPITSKDKNVGLVDEAVMKAQKESGAAYLTDVTVYRDGSCVVVEGTAMKMPVPG